MSSSGAYDYLCRSHRLASTVQTVVFLRSYNAVSTTESIWNSVIPQDIFNHSLHLYAVGYCLDYLLNKMDEELSPIYFNCIKYVLWWGYCYSCRRLTGNIELQVVLQVILTAVLPLSKWISWTTVTCFCRILDKVYSLLFCKMYYNQ